MRNFTELNQNGLILKCGIYMRYSIQKQSDGHSLEYQSNASKSLISMINGEFVGEFVDKAVSGFYTRIGAREGMLNLIKAIEDGKINCVVFYDESRLTRRIMDVYRDFYWPIMKANPNVIFYRASDGTRWNPRDPEAKRNLIDAYKESEKKRSYAINSQATMINSKIRPGSRLPLGVHAILSDRIVPDENLAIVIFIFELASWGYSEKKIADIVSDMDFNLLMPKTKRNLKQGNELPEVTSFEKVVKVWNHTSIHYILNNPIYIGQGNWNRRLKRNNSSPGPKEQLHRKRIMTINEEGKEIKKFSIRMNTTFKLSGIVQCSKCKQKLLTRNSAKSGKLHTRSGKPLCYYYCTVCNNLRIDSTQLDQKVLEQINHQLSKQYTEKEVIRKTKNWMNRLDKRIKDLEAELTQEEYFLQDKSFKKDLSVAEYETYVELSLHNIEVIKWEIEDLIATRKKCSDLISSNAVSILVNRVRDAGVDGLNFIEQRHIMFMALERVLVKADRNGGVIIDELAFKGIPIPYLSKNA